jgi:hypothetical protein
VVAAEVIGRERELAELGRFLDAADGLPAALVWEREPGIGKTVLWDAGLELARERGFRLLAAVPATAETRLSFAALGDLSDGVLGEVLPAKPNAAAILPWGPLVGNPSQIFDPSGSSVRTQGAWVVGQWPGRGPAWPGRAVFGDVPGSPWPRCCPAPAKSAGRLAEERACRLSPKSSTSAAARRLA